MKRYFITSSGTDIGKTYALGALCESLIAKNKIVSALKPIISGFSYECLGDNDIIEILSSLKLPKTIENIEKISLYRLKEPLSPDIAARKAKLELNFDEIVKFCNKPVDADYQLIEGVGGVRVPINSNKTTLDLMESLKIPVILVVGSYLGAISHTLSAIDSLNSIRAKISVIIISETDGSEVLCDDMITSLKNFTSIPIVKLDRDGKLNAAML